jgi:hypothetical protein
LEGINKSPFSINSPTGISTSLSKIAFTVLILEVQWVLSL